MITLSAPCRALMDREPLVVRPDDLVADIAETVKDVDYRAAVVVDGERRPVGLVTRSDLVEPGAAAVLLVDHAEQAQSVVGVEHAEIVEILDHHHIGSIETRIPVRATFDPVGSTATLVIERFRQSGMEPSRPAATLLLGAVLSDTVILNSPTTTDRDRAVIDYLEQVLALDATAFGREMFEAHVRPHARAGGGDRRARRQGVRRRRRPDAAHRPGRDRRPAAGRARATSCCAALEAAREREGHALAALMVTDILGKGTRALRVRATAAAVARAFGERARATASSTLPGVMSRKKQVAPEAAHRAGGLTPATR